MEEMVEYRGYVVFWRRFSNDSPWLAHIAAASPSLFPAMDQVPTIQSRRHGGQRQNLH
jgi:hypothetical protein